MGPPDLRQVVLDRLELIGSVFAGAGLIAVLGIGPFEPAAGEGPGGVLSSARGLGWPTIVLGVVLIALDVSGATERLRRPARSSPRSRRWPGP